ncbi:unnamed protein product [Dibothriocephalus latus]|uniref:Uncharacterized protein n=1 Tax=Dibothriocephalus latus TaxID=60516 RepID=A0A3P7LV87_DIBLA|nr:unnamed protein product [Dibothriocephalus latus]
MKINEKRCRAGVNLNKLCAGPVTYDWQSFEHKEHIEFVDGKLHVEAADRKTLNRLLAALGDGATVNNKERRNTITGYINGLEIEALNFVANIIYRVSRNATMECLATIM